MQEYLLTIFKAIVESNYEEVKTWPKWKQKIIISAEAADTGRLIMSEKEWKERFGDK